MFKYVIHSTALNLSNSNLVYDTINSRYEKKM